MYFFDFLKAYVCECVGVGVCCVCVCVRVCVCCFSLFIIIIIFFLGGGVGPLDLSRKMPKGANKISSTSIGQLLSY